MGWLFFLVDVGKPPKCLLEQPRFLRLNRMGMDGREGRMGGTCSGDNRRLLDREKVKRLCQGLDELLEVVDEVGL